MDFLLRWQHICDSQQDNAEKIVRWHYSGDVSIVEQQSNLQCCFYESDWLTDDRCMDYVNVKTGLCLLRENFQQTSFQKFLESFAAGPLDKRRIKFPTWQQFMHSPMMKGAQQSDKNILCPTYQQHNAPVSSIRQPHPGHLPRTNRYTSSNGYRTGHHNTW